MAHMTFQSCSSKLSASGMTGLQIESLSAHSTVPYAEHVIIGAANVFDKLSLQAQNGS